MLHLYPRKSRGLGAMQKQPSWGALAVLHAGTYDQVTVLLEQVKEFNQLLHQNGYPVKDVIIGVAFVEMQINQELHRRLQELTRTGKLPVKLTVLPIRQCVDEYGLASNALALEAAHKGCDTYLFWSPATIDYFTNDLLRTVGEGFDRGLYAMGGITRRDEILLGMGHLVRNISVFDANLFHMLGGFSVRLDQTLSGFGNIVKSDEWETPRLMMAMASYALSTNSTGLCKQIDLTNNETLHRSYGVDADRNVDVRCATRIERYNSPLPSHALPVIQDLAGEPLKL